MSILTLSPESLQAFRIIESALSSVSEHGSRLFYRGGVAISELQPKEALVSVTDGSSRRHPVRFQLTDGKVHVACDCDVVRRDPSRACAHIVAATYKLNNHLLYHPFETWETHLRGSLMPTERRGPAGTPSVLLFSLQKRHHAWNLHPYSLPVNLFASETLDTGTVVQTVVDRRLSGRAKPARSPIDARVYRNATGEAILAARQTSVFQGYAGLFDHTFHCGLYLAMLAEFPLFLGDEDHPLRKPLVVTKEPVKPIVEILRSAEGLRLTGVLDSPSGEMRLDRANASVLHENPLWVLIDSNAMPVNDSNGAILPFIESPEIRIPPDEEGVFLDHYLVRLAERVPIRGDAAGWREIDVEPVPRLYLTEEGRKILVGLRFAYDGLELPYHPDHPPVSLLRGDGPAALMRVMRKPFEEERRWRELSGYGLKRAFQPGHFELRARVDPVDFLFRQIPRLTNAGYEIHGEASLRSTRINRHRPALSMNVSSGIDWFDVETAIRFGEVEVPLKDVRKAIRRQERYVKLADGTMGELPEEWVRRFRRLLSLVGETDDGIRIENSRISLLEQLLSESDHARVDAEYRRRLDRLTSFRSITARETPRNFRGTLRPYQKAGYDWLHFLHEYGFGGCLADDMGIGKTVQALAFFLSLKESGHAKRASLIVMPRSLLFNWEREAARFAPDLRVTIHADATRSSTPNGFDDWDLVLTTYGVLLRDAALLREYPFHYVLLDESQAIKNPLSQTARATRLLQPDHRLVLTGTPVENTTMELWSQYAFLNPGLLGSIEAFKMEFASAIEKNRDEDAARLLRKLVYPFMLRRTKDMVAPELPPRTERILLNDMEPAQRKLYDRTRDTYRALLLGLMTDAGLDEHRTSEADGEENEAVIGATGKDGIVVAAASDGSAHGEATNGDAPGAAATRGAKTDGVKMANARMKALEGLLRLRQICCHPRLFDADFRGNSGKFEQLLETLETLRAEGHKALVFSQFVQMLRIVREELDARGIRTAYLDGQTRNRAEVVDAFQEDPNLSFFLISLRAGGTGMNLTAADYVIHIDPWWNPAVEMQATDRTHRIGQERPVIVTRLITKHSVEEKVLQLQERKRDLVGKLITTESGLFKSLTPADLTALFS